jgi:hypothetical protein
VVRCQNGGDAVSGAITAFVIGRGNDLFSRMLDKWTNASCTCWRNAESLDDAQVSKMDRFHVPFALSQRRFNLKRMRRTLFSYPQDVIRNAPISPVEDTCGPMHGQWS